MRTRPSSVGPHAICRPFPSRVIGLGTVASYLVLRSREWQSGLVLCGHVDPEVPRWPPSRKGLAATAGGQMLLRAMRAEYVAPKDLQLVVGAPVP